MEQIGQAAQKTCLKALLLLLSGYRYFISPLLGNRCRFYPSCSAYAQEALQQHNLANGLWLALKRVLRCHPFHPGGVDPVPSITCCKQQKALHRPYPSP